MIAASPEVTLEIVKTGDSDKFMNIYKDGKLYARSDGMVNMYIDKYNGLGWDENNLKHLLEFLGFKVFEVIKERNC